MIDALQQTLDTIELLENSDNKYRIEVKPNFDGDPNNASGEFSYDKNTGEYVITVEGTDGQYLPTFVHELEHANQLENGELYLSTDGNIQGYDINDEVDAYDIQHKFEYGIYDDVYDLKGNVVDGPYEITPDEIHKHFPELYNDLQGSGSGGSNGSGGNNEPDESMPSRSGSHP